MKASDALKTLVHQVADLEDEVVRLTKACAAADVRAFEATRTVALKPAVVSVPKSSNGAKTRGDWITAAVNDPASLQDKVGKYLGLPPYNTPSNIARNCKEYLSQLDREYGAGAVDAAIKILRKAQ